MDERLKEVARRLVEQREEQGSRLRYSAEVKRDAIAVLALARQRGRTTSSVAQALGVSVESLRRWVTGEAEPAGFRPVRVQPHGGAATVSVVSPGGFRIEGLDLAAAASVLRLLG